MTDSLSELLTKALAIPDPNPFLFNLGQVVRVRKKVINDGQTPLFWAGAKVRVLSRNCSCLTKSHWYVLQHPNGAQDHFQEYELDRRYSNGHQVWTDSNHEEPSSRDN
jgi:hypothetical protein